MIKKPAGGDKKSRRASGSPATGLLPAPARRGALRAVAAPPPGSDDYAGLLAIAFDRVLHDNLAGGHAQAGSPQVFRRTAGRARLDTDGAIFITRHGLKSKAVSDWLAVAQLPKRGVYDGLRLSPSTLSRKGKDQALDAAITERLVRQSELMVKAAEVFGEAAATWMTKGHPLLGGATPIDAAANEYGGTKVREILNAIEHGGVV
jgi:putative toxin-antitoxin system antitoxin component (TIGR02293 family)